MQRRIRQYILRQHIQRPIYRLFPLLLFIFLFIACGDLEGSGTAPDPEENVSDDSAVPTGDFGVSLTFGGPYLNDTGEAISSPDDERVVEVEPGDKFYVQVDYEDPSGITDIAVSLVNGSPEDLAGTLDPTQRFFTLGQPTDISEPSGCDLSEGPTSVVCIYEVRVADDAVNITELENSADEFAYVFRTKVTDAAGNTSDEAERGYVTIAGEDGDGNENGEPEPQPETCVNPVNIPDEIAEEFIREELDKPEGELTCEDLANLREFSVVDGNLEFIPLESIEGLQYAVNLESFAVMDGAQSLELDLLTGLPKLTDVFFGPYDITNEDLRVLGRIETLTRLYLRTGDNVLDFDPEEVGSKATDISPLANLTNLEVLGLEWFQELSDISPLEGLAELRELTVNYTDVSDISPLAGLTALETLIINYSDVRDLSPLANNEGLGEGDEINLRFNDFSTCPGTEAREAIDTLIERGAEVEFDEPRNCDTDSGSEEVCTNPVEIPSELIEREIRAELGKSEGDITCGDLASLTELRFSVLDDPTDDQASTINSFAGLQFAVNLRVLEIVRQVTIKVDLEPLRDLEFERLDLDNVFTDDLSPLVDNSSLGEGDEIDLRGNALETCPGTQDRGDIDTLIGRGVEVDFIEVDNCDAGGGIIIVTTVSGAASLEDLCTLRAAITAANTDSAVGGCPAGEGTDVIVLSAEGGTHTLSEVDNETNGPNGLPVVTSALILEGRRAAIARSTPQDGSEFRILEVAETGTLTLQDVTLERGFLSEDAPNTSRGGGIYNLGTVTLNRSSVSENEAFDAGGIYNGGTMRFNDSDVSENIAAGEVAGGIENTGTLIVENGSTISGNTSDSAIGGLLNSGEATVSDSFIQGNSAVSSTGALFSSGEMTLRDTVIENNSDDGNTFSNAGEMELINVTYRDNTDAISNGFFGEDVGIMTISSSTITGNSRDGLENSSEMTLINSTVSGNGDTGVVNETFSNRLEATLTVLYSTVANNTVGVDNQSGTVSLEGSIVADNDFTDPSDAGEGQNCRGNVSSEGYNLDTDGTCNLGQETDLSNVEAQLGPLQDNGGPTFTLALQEGSPAIDAIPTEVCDVGTDQRGVSRPQGEACDIGAFEVEQ